MRSQLFLNILNGVLLCNSSLLCYVFWIVLVLGCLGLSEQALHHTQGIDERFVWWPRPTLYVIMNLITNLNQICKVLPKCILGLLFIIFCFLSLLYWFLFLCFLVGLNLLLILYLNMLFIHLILLLLRILKLFKLLLMLFVLLGKDALVGLLPQNIMVSVNKLLIR